MLWDIQKIAKEDDYKILELNKLNQKLEEFMSYYYFLQKQIVELKNRLESQILRSNKWIIKELAKELKTTEKKQDKVIEKMLETIHKDKELSECFKCVKSVSGIGNKSSLLNYVFS